jgi:hypothetical protein
MWFPSEQMCRCVGTLPPYCLWQTLSRMLPQLPRNACKTSLGRSVDVWMRRSGLQLTMCTARVYDFEVCQQLHTPVHDAGIAQPQTSSRLRDAQHFISEWGRSSWSAARTLCTLVAEILVGAVNFARRCLVVGLIDLRAVMISWVRYEAAPLQVSSLPSQQLGSQDALWQLRSPTRPNSLLVQQQRQTSPRASIAQVCSVSEPTSKLSLIPSPYPVTECLLCSVLSLTKRRCCKTILVLLIRRACRNHLLIASRAGAPQ